ncbi:hypothetical protein VNO80_27093 [Phaseolus coccineus]|uniref:Uncharacterized protein n=1 Tax=Phaseolus coccineus TaxID=3886 RepID=A0AAN9QF23_PHACN
MDRLQAEINLFSSLHEKIKHLHAQNTQKALALSEVRNKLLGEVENLKKEMAQKEENANKMVESLKDDATQAFLAGFEMALEKATVVYPTMDLSALDPGKTVVDS